MIQKAEESDFNNEPLEETFDEPEYNTDYGYTNVIHQWNVSITDEHPIKNGTIGCDCIGKSEGK